MMDDAAKEEILAIAMEDLDLYHTDDRPPKKMKLVRIRYKGRWLIMPSGKTIWKCAGHAKNALSSSERSPCDYRYDTRGYRLRKSGRPIGPSSVEAKKYYREAIRNLVEFVEIEEQPA